MHFYESNICMAVLGEVCYDPSLTFPFTHLGLQSYWLSSSFRALNEEHLVFGVMKDNHRQPTGIQIHSSRTGEVSADELGTSGEWKCICAVMSACVYFVCVYVKIFRYTEFFLLFIYLHTQNSVVDTINTLYLCT